MGLAHDTAEVVSSVALLSEFHQQLLKWNERYNLISRRDSHRIVSRHLLDSLSASPFLKGRRIADIGSGAGLPGIPLAILHPQLDVTLVERSEKKCRFLRHCVRHLGLGRVQVVNKDAASIMQTGSAESARAVGEFDSVVSRAVSSPVQCLSLARNLLVENGRVVLLCGAEEPDKEQSGRFRLLERVMINIPGLTRKHQIQVYGLEHNP